MWCCTNLQCSRRPCCRICHRTVQSVTQVQATADIQNVLLVLKRMPEDVDATAWWPSRRSSDQASATLQPDPSWGDAVANAGAIHSPFKYASTGISSRLLGGHNCGGMKSDVSLAKRLFVYVYTTHKWWHWWRQHHVCIESCLETFFLNWYV